ncbi:hypothetical protein GMI69_03850 [Eggerthellaceae bacterium zg-887]|uniref:hypothetical protein n=1 Tax=Xiamenia xianingshaonis TaxID=2682776 RepID=UPI001409A388|nr:hypothetical protein [Xiamenia xianingshaonis]NHM15806.1 hypothetical protein [Xiamenia xianingshaonis]
MNERRTIDVEELVVDEENPRFEAVSTEDDALYSILADQKLGTGNKILNLARDIVAHGLNASELLIVSPIEGTDTYRVREGNRRVTAIKLSLFSERIPEDFRKLAPRFEELADAMQAHRLIECCICDDEDEIRRLLLLRHGGESNGVGTVKWNSAQTTRFNEEGNPQTARALSFVGHLQEDYGQGNLWKAAAVIPPTNLGRLITTPEVRQMLNIDADGNEAHYRGGHDALLLDVLLTLKDKGVGAIYDKGARVRLVEEAAERLEPDGQRQARLPWDENGLFDSTDLDVGRCSGAAGTDSRIDTIRDGSHDALIDNQSQGPSQEPAADETSESPQSDGPSSHVETLDDGQQDTPVESVNNVRRKPVSKAGEEAMFGHVLRPKGPKSNDVYRAIDWIDQQYLLDPTGMTHLLPILGFSLRLLMETVAREYYQDKKVNPGESPFNTFMENVAKPVIKDRLDESNQKSYALASEWIDGNLKFEGLCHQWAHGAMPVDRASLVRQSKLAALIIDEVWT